MFIRLIPAAILLAALLLPACRHAAPGSRQVHHTHKVQLDASWYDSLGSFLQGYTELGKALHREDTLAADRQAAFLQEFTRRLADGVTTASQDPAAQDNAAAEVAGSLGSMAAELDGLQGETSLDGKRDAYRMLSEMCYDLLLLTGLKGRILYRVHDATAFDNRGASWLQWSPGPADDPYNTQPGARTVTDTLRLD